MLTRFSLFLLFILPYFAMSQSSAVTTGIVQFQSGNYEEALTKFNQALQDPSSLKDKAHFNAWYYKGKALIQEYGIAINSGDPAQVEKKYDYVLIAGTSFLKAYELAENNSLKSQVKSEFATVVPMLLQLGLIEFNNGNTLKAKEYFSSCKEINQLERQPNDYMIYDFSGQVALSLKDSTAALDDFKIAIYKYKTNPPARPDFMIGYSFYRTAVVHYLRDDIDPALTSLQNGLKLLKDENDRRLTLISENSENRSQLEGAEQEYLEIKSYLETFELDLYLNYPDKFDEALQKFEQAVKENPKNETTLLAYATLLEKKDPDAGFDMYKKVLEINPNNSSALFNAGANRINKGVEEARLSNEETDYTRSMEHEAKMKAYYKEALPFMEKHHALSPKDRETLRVLKQITIQLEMMEDYQKYKEKEAQL